MDAAACGRKIREALTACRLGAWPTPLEPAAALGRAVGLAQLWLKREDAAGGNKVRGLEFLLAHRTPGTVLVTVGGAGSTHCLTTARHARALGYHAAVALFPQPETEASRAVGAAIGACADLVVRARTRAGLPLALLRAWWGARAAGRGPVRWMPGGGAHPRAVAGHVLAALELGAQLDAAPDALVVPLGTGGTAAGLALGLAWLGWPTRVIAVRVAPRIVANRARTVRLARGAARLLANVDPTFAERASRLRLDVVNGLGAGYGHPTPAGEAAARLAREHGLRLDPTYGAKAFGVLLGPLDRGVRRVVFWHTFAWP